MSKYINLDDPDVTYSHNAGNHEVYIVGSEAERIDIVRCGECKWLVKSEDVCKLLSNNYEPPVYVESSDFCSRGERREDG